MILAVGGGFSHSYADSPPSREYLIKAAFLYNFAKFVEWPSAAFSADGAPFTLCILGQDSFGAALRTVRGKTVKSTKLTIRHVSSARKVEACHILFISKSEKPRLKPILASVKELHLLTVGEMASFAQTGGIINFFELNNKIRFEINVAAAKRAGLKISSKLLKLAKVVNEGVRK
jgi:hypothetical protein